MTGFLSDRELTDIRTEVLKVLPDTCTILNVVYTSDSMGGYTETYGTIGTDIACKLARSTRNENAQIVGGQIEYESIWTLHVAYDQEIEPGHLVVSGGGTWNVMEVYDIHSWRALRDAKLRLLE